MRRRLVAGNWKLHGSKAMVNSLVSDVINGLENESRTEVAICPPFVYLQQADSLLAGSAVRLGAQNVSAEMEGAYTGEVSAAMLLDVGCTYVIVGHSERRTLYAEDDDMVGRKFHVAQQAGLIPILCVGETLEERNSGATEAVVARQLKAVIAAAGADGLAKGVIAYEPIWAIGTGKTATPQQAQEVHEFIRELIRQHSSLADQCRLLYGGSVKPDNAAELFSMPDIDGGLIGGASLKAGDFLAICTAA